MALPPPEHRHGPEQAILLVDDGERGELYLQPHAIATAQQPAAGVSGASLLEGGGHGPTGFVRAGGGIIAQLDEPLDLLGTDAPRLLEAHPENPLGGLVLETHCPRGVADG